MTINEARNGLITIRMDKSQFLTPTEIESIKMGEEALKRVQGCRKILCDIGQKLLPGETKE